MGNLYNELKSRKDSGEVLDISMLNEEILRELWWVRMFLMQLLQSYIM